MSKFLMIYFNLTTLSYELKSQHDHGNMIIPLIALNSTEMGKIVTKGNGDFCKNWPLFSTVTITPHNDKIWFGYLVHIYFGDF